MTAPGTPRATATGGHDAPPLNMDFGLSEEQEALVEAARTVLEGRTSLERLKEADASERWYDLETWSALAAADVLGAAVPEADGGLGYGILELALLLEQVGRTVAPVPMLAALVGFGVPLSLHGTGGQRALLGGLARGEVIGTAALFEPGTEVEAPTTTADRDGDGWILRGAKELVPAANVASHILVPAAVDDEIGLFLVEPGAPEASIERQQVLGLEPHFAVTLDGTRVDDSARVGEIDQGRSILRRIHQHMLVGLCAVASGVTAREVEITAAYACEREQFGRPIGTFQAVGQRLADAYIATQGVRLTMLLAATRLAEGRDAAMEAATAKFWAAEGADNAGHAALHVHAGISIDLDYPIHRYFLWGKQIEMALGAATPQLQRIGRMLADPVG